MCCGVERFYYLYVILTARKDITVVIIQDLSFIVYFPSCINRYKTPRSWLGPPGVSTNNQVRIRPIIGKVFQSFEGLVDCSPRFAFMSVLCAEEVSNVILSVSSNSAKFFWKKKISNQEYNQTSLLYVFEALVDGLPRFIFKTFFNTMNEVVFILTGS